VAIGSEETILASQVNALAAAVKAEIAKVVKLV
jgi:hypothetical protein